jgi:hypothetical protein
VVGSLPGFQINFVLFASAYLVAVVLWTFIDSTKPVVPAEEACCGRRNRHRPYSRGLATWKAGCESTSAPRARFARSQDCAAIAEKRAGSGWEAPPDPARFPLHFPLFPRAPPGVSSHHQKANCVPLTDDLLGQVVEGIVAWYDLVEAVLIA